MRGTLRWSAGFVASVVSIGVVAACAGARDESPRSEDERVESTAEGLTASLPASADTYLDEDAPNKAFGARSALRLSDDEQNRVLVRFDLASLTGAQSSLASVTSATLRFTVAEAPRRCEARGLALSVHRMKRAWTEGGATFRCPDDINPSNSAFDCPASVGGGWDMDSERSSQAPWVLAPTDLARVHNGVGGSVSFDVTADVRAFLSGATPNHGWLVRVGPARTLYGFATPPVGTWSPRSTSKVCRTRRPGSTGRVISLLRKRRAIGPMAMSSRQRRRRMVRSTCGALGTGSLPPRR